MACQQIVGKVTNTTHRKNPHQQIINKFDRRNQNKQKQQAKHRENLREKNIFAGRDGAARIVAIIPLCDGTDAAAAATSLSNALDIAAKVPTEGLFQVKIDRFKQKIQYIIVRKNLMECLDAGRIADLIIFVLSPDQEVDHVGESIIRCIENQGLSTLLTVVQGLDKVEPSKKRCDILSSLKTYINHFHPEQEKIYNLDSRQECINLMRSVCTVTPRGIRWREERSWMLIDEVKWPQNSEESVVLSGTVRGKGLNANRLVQVGDWGTFQIEKITSFSSSNKDKINNDMVFHESKTEDVLEIPDDDQDTLSTLAPEEFIFQDSTGVDMSAPVKEKRGVLLDDHHYFSDDESHLPTIPKRLPRGTSAYQAAWFLGDEYPDSDSYSDDIDEQGDVAMDAPALPQDGIEGLAPQEPTEIAPTLYATSENFLDPNPDDESEAEQLAAYRGKKRNDAEDDRDFPDEIELHPKVLARERLARYRGLKSLRSSHWEEEEDRAYEPQDWRRLLQVKNYKSARNIVTNEALVGGVSAGSRVRVYIRNVPLSLRAIWETSTRPLSLFSLLRHEHKLAVVNFRISLSSDCTEPIKSKTEMILQCGPRRFIIKPLFSEGTHTKNDVHKFNKYLHPGQTAVATFVGPITWGSVPILLFQRNVGNSKMCEIESQQLPLTLLGTGTSLPVSSSRVIAKRIILTGHPYKIHKKLVTIRYMFFNREDVEWFKALQLWTKRGRSGYIKEPLGTHGYFKANFDGKINPQDSVGVSLYKRMWPRTSQLLCNIYEPNDVLMEG